MPSDPASATSPPPAAKRRRKRRAASAGLYGPKTATARARQRFFASRTRDFGRHLGANPSIAQRILMTRAIRCEWDLRLLDRRLDEEGELSQHAVHLRASLENRLRLDLSALGLKAEPERAAPLHEVLAREHRARLRKEARKAAARRRAEAQAALEAAGPISAPAEPALAPTAFLGASRGAPDTTASPVPDLPSVIVFDEPDHDE